MKRAFLWGLAWALMVIVVAEISFGFGLGVHNQTRFQSLIWGIVFVPPALLTIWAARRAPHGRSWLLAVVGWLLGYFALGAAGVVLFVAVMLFDRIAG
jgi:hypothetical protein